ncbi:hypothetical protein M4J06_007217 [Streptomyces coelicoflavus]|uniref:hypothetical protein n=1 Tax=Streptomyces coelicoflavus TaxID=285562 RepID=UPI00210C1279|nr:hypothetical protein [Streptomyces coelicoflavus]MCQ4202699.1 hypothetical protein [Streptomyces coelicoflavus]
MSSLSGRRPHLVRNEQEEHVQGHHIASELPARQLPDRLRTVGPGWHVLLLRLHTQLLVLEPDYRIHDLKEKLGAVRIRITSACAPVRPEIRSLLTSAEEQSATTCEFCGSPGRRRRRNDEAAGWIKAVCEDCHSAWSDHSIMIVNGAVRHRRPRNG